MPKSKEFVSDSESDSDYEAPKSKKVRTEKKVEKKEEKKEVKKAPAANSSGEKTFQISRNRWVSVSQFRGKVMVGIREFYEADGEMKPGKKGISLPLDQWDMLKKQIEDIDEAVKEMR